MHHYELAGSFKSHRAWSPVTLAIARIIAAKPHSCDVERLISAINNNNNNPRTTFIVLSS